MGAVRYTRKARQDLIDIWRHIAAESPATADQCLDRIEARCKQLAAFPEIGRERRDIAPDARMLVVERWIAIYRVVEQGVQIVRIVDGARDLSRLALPQK
ncbi:type II toxin-antitoxin system RelE/ParE family toxin [Rhodopseudomonas palustris]|uniref:Plasmid stabilization system n=1 Tax=Rhodopseudomonas palustris (strain BisB18) TaxID=316056 RepID=Q216B6_RHOPB